jgi:glycosyltransferase involved in cell wall biosynthesis
MKIALIGNDYVQQFPLENYGGIETCVENLANGLFNENKDFFVVCPKRNLQKKYPFEIYETEQDPTSISKKDSSYYAYSVAKVLENLEFDAIWSQSHWSIEPLLKFNKPIICTFQDSCEKQSSWIKKYPNVKYRFVSKYQYKNWVTESWEEKISFQCYTGLEKEEFLQQQKENYFLWCAGLQWGLEAKGLDIFIDLAKANKNHKFIAYGSGNPELEKYLYNLNMPNFSFMGDLKRGDFHKKVFAQARALIMPTRIMDTFPRTCLEAISKGTPIIGSSNGSIPEIINLCGGKICESIDDYSEALNINFDYNEIFNKSKQFQIKNEVETLIKESNFNL